MFPEAFQDAFADLIALRRDVRRFRPDPVGLSEIEALTALADLAPSVGLAQPWRWVIVEDPGRRAGMRSNFERANRAALDGYDGEARRLYATLKLAGLDVAPMQLAVFVEPEPAEGRGLGRQTMPETVAYSAVCAIHTLWLAARARGLGVGWVSILEPDGIAALLDVPASWRFIAWLCIGWPAEEGREPELQRAGWEKRRRIEVIRR